MFLNRGLGRGIHHELSFFFQKRGLCLFSHCLLLIFHSCIWKTCFAKRKGRQTQQQGNSSSARTEEEPRRRCWPGPALEGGQTRGGQAALGLLTFSHKQRGRRKGQGGEMGKGSATGGNNSVGHRECNPLPLRNFSPQWFAFKQDMTSMPLISLLLSLKKKKKKRLTLIIASVYK